MFGMYREKAGAGVWTDNTEALALGHEGDLGGPPPAQIFS